jgi:glycerophosphoryl diester phosphodiesterase
MKKISLLGLLLLGSNFLVAQVKLDRQGHRGCRGLMPENTIPAMKKALDLGVQTLELDVVISQDQQVVVSHEAYMASSSAETGR